MVKTYIGQKIIHLESVDSTNNYTANLLKEGKISSGTVILSDIQTEGRGQRANSWQSLPFENLTFSFLLKPSNVSNISPITINHCVSLALAEFISAQGLTPQLKWPNDIYVNNQKIAGILIENNFKSGVLNISIIGIGININQTSFNSLNASSLALLTGKKYPIKGVLFDIIYQLNKQFSTYESNSADLIKNLYDQNLWNRDISTKFMNNGREIEGVIQGTDKEGSLLILVDGEVQTYRNGEIMFLIKSR